MTTQLAVFIWLLEWYFNRLPFRVHPNSVGVHPIILRVHPFAYQTLQHQKHQILGHPSTPIPTAMNLQPPPEHWQEPLLDSLIFRFQRYTGHGVAYGGLTTLTHGSKLVCKLRPIRSHAGRKVLAAKTSFLNGLD